MFSDRISLLESSQCAVDVQETFTELKLRGESKYINWDIVSVIISSLSEISPRDSFEFSIELDGTVSPKISNCDRVEFSLIQTFFDENCEEAEELRISIDINKVAKDSVSSIYGLSYFKGYFQDNSLKNSLISLSRFFSEVHYFEVFESIDPFASISIGFYSHLHPESKIQLAKLIDRKAVINFIRENSSEVIVNAGFLAQDFELASTSGHDHFDIFFSKAHIVLFLSSISNVFLLENDDTVSFKIDGYKSVHIDSLHISALTYDQTKLAELTQWLFESAGKTDKLGLARNVISLSLDESGKVQIDGRVIRSILSNYAVYLKDNVQQYIEIKNKVTDYIFDHSDRIHQILEEYLSNFRVNLLALVGFILSVVLVNGLKDSGPERIFSAEYLFIVGIICSLSALWMLFLYFNLSSRAEKYNKNLRSVLKRNYYKVMDSQELESYINPVMTESCGDFKSQLKTYSIWWACILALIFVSFCIAFLMFDKPVLEDIPVKNGKSTVSAFEKSSKMSLI